MRVIQQKERELVLLDETTNQVRLVPNLPYFSLKYLHYAGNTISYVISKKPDMAIYENEHREFTCNYNDMKIIISTEKEIDKLCEIISTHKELSDVISNSSLHEIGFDVNDASTPFVNFFCKHFAQENQDEILRVFFAPYAHRIKKEIPGYVIDGVFGMDKWGNAYVNNPEKKNFPWQEISMEVGGDIQEYKIISSFDGQDLIMDAELQRFVTKTFYLLNTEKKEDPLFMIQLPKKVQRWVDLGNLSIPVKWDKTVEIPEEKIFVPKCYGFFPTPKVVVKLLVENANLEEGMKILEPSAGQGAILEYLKEYDVTCGELYSGNRTILEEKGYPVLFDNFLEYAEYEKYDRIIMNPPFAKQEDLDHVNHAYKMLKPGGRLVSVMATSVTFRNNKKSKEFRELVEKKGYFIELPKDSFKESGTGVYTVIVVIDK